MNYQYIDQYKYSGFSSESSFENSISDQQIPFSAHLQQTKAQQSQQAPYNQTNIRQELELRKEISKQIDYYQKVKTIQNQMQEDHKNQVKMKVLRLLKNKQFQHNNYDNDENELQIDQFSIVNHTSKNSYQTRIISVNPSQQQYNTMKIQERWKTISREDDIQNVLPINIKSFFQQKNQELNEYQILDNKQSNYKHSQYMSVKIENEKENLIKQFNQKQENINQNNHLKKNQIDQDNHYFNGHQLGSSIKQQSQMLFSSIKDQTQEITINLEEIVKRNGNEKHSPKNNQKDSFKFAQSSEQQNNVSYESTIQNDKQIIFEQEKLKAFQLKKWNESNQKIKGISESIPLKLQLKQKEISNICANKDKYIKYTLGENQNDDIEEKKQKKIKQLEINQMMRLNSSNKKPSRSVTPNKPNKRTNSVSNFNSSQSKSQQKLQNNTTKKSNNFIPSSYAGSFQSGKGKNPNKNKIKCAIAQACLAGEANSRERALVLQLLDNCYEKEHFVILFKTSYGRHDFRAMYTIEDQKLKKLFEIQRSPEFIEEVNIIRYLKYESGSKDFKEIVGNKNLSFAVDAVQINLK